MIGFCVAKISGAKFIFDPRGLFVEELSFEGKVRKGGVRFKILKFLEKKFILSSHSVICVSRKMADFFLQHYPTLNSSRVFVIPNATTGGIQPSGYKGTGVRRRFVYLGSARPWHMFEAVVDFMNNLSNRCSTPNELCVISADVDIVRKICENLNSDVELSIFSAPSSKVKGIIKDYDYGFCLRRSDVISEVSSPVKFFEYVSTGVKVIFSSDCGDLDLYGKKFDIGLSVDNDQPVDRWVDLFLEYEEANTCRGDGEVPQEVLMENYLKDFVRCYA